MVIIAVLFAIGFYFLMKKLVRGKNNPPVRTGGIPIHHPSKPEHVAVAAAVGGLALFLTIGIPIILVIITIVLLPFPPFNFIVPFFLGMYYIRWRKNGFRF